MKTRPIPANVDLFKVKNEKDVKYVQSKQLNIFHTFFSSISIVDFEQVNVFCDANREPTLENTLNYI